MFELKYRASNGTYHVVWKHFYEFQYFADVTKMEIENRKVIIQSPTTTPTFQYDKRSPFAKY